MLAKPLGRQLRSAGPSLAAAARPVGRRAAARASPAAVVAASSPDEGRLPAAPVRRVALDGSAAGEATLALHTAREATAVGLVHRYLTLVRQNARRGTAATKTRANVSGGGKKPFDQKGTGQARRGSSRSPLVRGGGVSFGPQPRDWSIKMNKKERRLAMATALQTAASSMTVVDDLVGADAFPGAKTRSVAEALARWGAGPGDHVLLVTREVAEDVARPARNLANLVHSAVGGLSVYDVLRADKIVVEAGALAHLNEWYGAGGAAWA